MEVWSTLDLISKLNATIHVFESRLLPWMYISREYHKRDNGIAGTTPPKQFRRKFVARGIFFFGHKFKYLRRYDQMGFRLELQLHSIRFMLSPLMAAIISLPSLTIQENRYQYYYHFSWTYPPLHHVSISTEKHHKPKKVGQKYLNQFEFYFRFVLFFQLKRKEKRKEKIFYVKIRFNLWFKRRTNW